MSGALGQGLTEPDLMNDPFDPAPTGAVAIAQDHCANDENGTIAFRAMQPSLDRNGIPSLWHQIHPSCHIRTAQSRIATPDLADWLRAKAPA